MRNNSLPRLTDQGLQKINDLAQRYGVSVDAVMKLLQALVISNGTMAQFDHPELGGAGQWMPGGMTIVGDMFNHGLKTKVDGLFRAVTNPGCATLRTIPRRLSVAITEAGRRPARGRPRRLGYGFGQPLRTRDGRPNVGSMVASRTGVPQRDWRAAMPISTKNIDWQSSCMDM